MTRYTGAEVAAKADITYRQLDLWVRTGLVWPSQPSQGRGFHRAYDDEDLAWVVALAALVRLGVDPGTLRRALRGGVLLEALEGLESAAFGAQAAVQAWALASRQPA